MAVKLSLKRGRDDDMMGIPSPLGRCAGPQLSSPRPASSQFDLGGPAKRARRSDYASSPSRVHFQNFFPPREVEKDVSEKVSHIVRSTKRKQKPPGKVGEKVFTLDEVKEIVAKAVAEREEEIRLEYDDILSKRLQEQFESFARYNEDCISRRMKDSDFSYMS